MTVSNPDLHMLHATVKLWILWCNTEPCSLQKAHYREVFGVWWPSNLAVEKCLCTGMVVWKVTKWAFKRFLEGLQWSLVFVDSRFPVTSHRALRTLIWYDTTVLQGGRSDDLACYLFDCKSPSLCVFTSHPGFAVLDFSYAKDSDPHADELDQLAMTSAGTLSSTTSATTTTTTASTTVTNAVRPQDNGRGKSGKHLGFDIY